MEDELCASAADWVVELFGGIHLRYAHARCDGMPLRSCDFWRLANEGATRGMAGSQQGGIWACP
eukprot:9678755-Lingulodinium_polyedra.AAC.1